MMNRIARIASSLFALALTCAALAGCAASGIVRAYNEQGSSTDTVREYYAEGYPLDRSGEQMARMESVQFVVELDSLSVGDAVWLTPDGRAPVYMREGRSPTQDEGREVPMIATPVTGRVIRNMWGDVGVKSMVTVFISGGMADGVLVRTSEEVAPNLKNIVTADSIVVAGAFVTTRLGVGLDPWFVYRRDGNVLTSLLESAGNDQWPSFEMDKLSDMLHQRVCAQAPSRTERGVC